MIKQKCEICNKQKGIAYIEKKLVCAICWNLLRAERKQKIKLNDRR